jgi:hypothetical protein
VLIISCLLEKKIGLSFKHAGTRTEPQLKLFTTCAGSNRLLSQGPPSSAISGAYMPGLDREPPDPTSPIEIGFLLPPPSGSLSREVVVVG